MNLFFLATILNGSTTDNTKPGPLVSSAISRIPILSAFFVLIMLAPSTVENERFLLVVAFIRLCIFFPFFSAFSASRDSSTEPGGLSRSLNVTFLAVSVALVAFQISEALQETDMSILRILSAVNEYPSVSALGYDYVLGLVSIAAWRFQSVEIS